MKKLFYGFIAVILMFCLLSGTADVLAAGDPPFSGHWAAVPLNKALNDALIIGDGTAVKPDDAITGAQIVTILCRVFLPKKTADLSGVTDISKNDWYYDAASKAAAMGMIKPVNGRLNLAAPLTRAQAFMILADAFQLVPALPDTTVLDQFSDAGGLTGEERNAAAALIASGFVKGDGNLLHSDKTITLAELLTILYRIVPDFRLTGQSGPTAAGGIVVSGDAFVNGKKFSYPLYFDCTASAVALQSVEAPCVVLRSDALRSFSVSSCKIDRLVIAAGSGDVNLWFDGSTKISTVAVGDGSGTVTLSGAIQNAEITGDGRTVVIGGPVQNLLIGGSNCTLTVNPAAAVGTVKILGSGVNNALKINGSCQECDIYGAKSAVSGYGKIQKIVDNTAGGELGVSAADQKNNSNYGLTAAALALNAPANVGPYQTLNASVTITAPNNGSACKGLWYIDGVLKSQSDITLEGTTTSSLSISLKNASPNPKTVTVSFVLFFNDSIGGYQEIRADEDVILDAGNKYDSKEVMDLVTTGYKGDFTLEWAQSHDFDSDLKTAWVNLKGYTSETNYLVWVSIAYQRVNIFTGSAGNWKLEKTFLVGTGAPGKDTPVGVFKVLGRKHDGWTTDDYTVKPVVYWYSYAYGFHSRLYYPDSTDLEDDRIGFPISHGCIRMYDDDVNWMYDYIPSGTTVVSY